MHTPRFFYGWVIVGFTFALQFVAIGLSYYAFSVFLKPLTELLGSDRFYVSITMSIQSVMIGVVGPLAGHWFSRFPLRLLLLAGVTCIATGFLLLPHITAVWQLWLLYGGLVGLGSVLLGVIPCNLMLANWFSVLRGRAMGISQFGITISGTVLVPLITWLVHSYGLAVAFSAAGIATAVVLIPLIFLFAVRTPEERGLHPDGASTPPPDPVGLENETWTFGRALRHRDIWLLTLTVGPCYMGIASVILAMPAHITDLGLTALQASGVVSLTTLLGAIAKPTFGTLSDYVNKKVATGLAILLQATGVSLLLVAETYSALLVAGALFGLGYGAMAPLWGVLLSARFGRRAFAQVMGANQPMLMPFNIVGFPVTNLIFESTQSYLPAFTLLLFGYAIAIISIWRFHLPATEGKNA